MSKIEVKLEDKILTIEKNTARKSEKNIQEINLDEIKYGKKYKSSVKITNEEDKNKILFLQEVDFDVEDEVDELASDEEENNNNEQVVIEKPRKVVFVYSEGAKIMYRYCSLDDAYKYILKIKYKVLGISIKPKKVKVKVLAYIVNKYGVEYGEQKFYIDRLLGTPCKLKEYPKKIKSKVKAVLDGNIYTFKFDTTDIIEDETTINSPVRFTININGKEVNYKLAKKKKKLNKRYYYNPMKGSYAGEFAIHMRRSYNARLVFVKRLKEPIEDTLKFKILESRLVSNLMYYVGKILSKIRRKKINVFYEKFTSKVEEGAYDLFLLFQTHKNTRNYFIIDENSEDYQKIKDNPGVVKKYSFKYYWVIYNANNWIATEAPSHLNIIRSNNGILRKAFTDKKFIFLQHGVTYLKCHGKNSTFGKGKEGQVNLIVAGSEKEKDAIVEMLGVKEEQVLKTGLPIFSKIEYNHINNDSDDMVTIMLTWKPYEEQLYNFEESTYYQYTVAIYNMLTKYIDKDKISIVPHPKVYDLLTSTDIKDSVWEGKISDILSKTKVLITDYSSVCYNAFYQGAGVVFFQPDLEKFEQENGKLVPNDDEYIGPRTFSMEELEDVMSNTIKNRKIDLENVRNKDYEEIYSTINEFSDGKNIDRIYQELLDLGII